MSKNLKFSDIDICFDDAIEQENPATLVGFSNNIVAEAITYYNPSSGESILYRYGTNLHILYKVKWPDYFEKCYKNGIYNGPPRGSVYTLIDFVKIKNNYVAWRPFRFNLPLSVYLLTSPVLDMRLLNNDVPEIVDDATYVINTAISTKINKEYKQSRNINFDDYQINQNLDYNLKYLLNKLPNRTLISTIMDDYLEIENQNRINNL